MDNKKFNRIDAKLNAIIDRAGGRHPADSKPVYTRINATVIRRRKKG